MVSTEKKRKTIIDILFIAAMLVVGYFVIKYVAVWTLPFLIGFVVAIILQKPVKGFHIVEVVHKMWFCDSSSKLGRNNHKTTTYNSLISIPLLSAEGFTLNALPQSRHQRCLSITHAPPV